MQCQLERFNCRCASSWWFENATRPPSKTVSNGTFILFWWWWNPSRCPAYKIQQAHLFLNSRRVPCRVVDVIVGWYLIYIYRERWMHSTRHQVQHQSMNSSSKNRRYLQSRWCMDISKWIGVSCKASLTETDKPLPVHHSIPNMLMSTS